MALIKAKSNCIMEDAVQTNRSGVKYAPREQVMRVLWAMALVLFRASPRPFFGFRRWLLKLFGARIGVGVNVYPSSHIYFPWHLEMRDWSCLGEWALVYNLGPVTIEEGATVSQRVHLCAGTHDYHDPAMPLMKQPITIGASAWICADAFVGPNVTVGEGAVIGARAVAVKDVPAWTVVAGNPARVIKKRECFAKKETE